MWKRWRKTPISRRSRPCSNRRWKKIRRTSGSAASRRFADRSRADRWRGGIRGGRRDARRIRNPGDKRRALLRSGALRRNRSAMHFHEMLDDRQPQTEAEGRSRRRPVLLAEPFEHVRQKLRGNAAASVLDDQLHEIAVALYVDLDAAAFIAELDGVVYEVPQHLLQPRGVCRDLPE